MQQILLQEAMANTENLSYMRLEDDQALLDKLWEFSFLLIRERAEGLVQYSDTYPERIALGLHTDASVKTDFFAEASGHWQFTLRSESVASTAVDMHSLLQSIHWLRQPVVRTFFHLLELETGKHPGPAVSRFLHSLHYRWPDSRGVEEIHSHLRDETRRKRNGVISKEARFFKSCNSGILNQRAVENINISMSEVATAPRSLWRQPMRRTWLPTCTPWPEDMGTIQTHPTPTP